MKAVSRFGITTLAGVPPLWAQLLEIDWTEEATSHLKRLTNSGGALSPSLIGGLRARFPAAKLYAMYGLTEAFRSTYLDPAPIDAQRMAAASACRFGLMLESVPLSAALLARSEEHTSELQSLMRISYAVFCLKQK